MNQSARKIIVLGAGPGGLTAALAGALLGLDVEIYEQAPVLTDVGYGLMLHSNGLNVLSQLGLYQVLRSQMRESSRLITIFPARGKSQIINLKQIEVPFNWAAMIARYDLVKCFVSALEQRNIPIHFGHRVIGADLHGENARLQFENGKEVTGDYIIGADGANSVIREKVGFDFEKQGPHGSYLRMVVENPLDLNSFKDVAVKEYWGSGGRRIGLCPLPNNKLYVFTTAPQTPWDLFIKDFREREEWIHGLSSFDEDVAKVLAQIKDWHQVHHSTAYSVKAASFYHQRCFLLGDAAHAMTPNLGQGANSAMTDAWVLLNIIAKGIQLEQNAEVIGREYDRIRKEFVTKIQETARQIGLIAETKSAVLTLLRDIMIPLISKVPFLSKLTLPPAMGCNPLEAQFFSFNK